MNWKVVADGSFLERTRTEIFFSEYFKERNIEHLLQRDGCHFKGDTDVANNVYYYFQDKGINVTLFQK